ncbi:fungal specific transcription factor domain-containing protein [Aspergillus lucknowensis]|uniref:Xylanolytic transcriptional activator regulatory domain-containing protein n=1 Tax=Aspergillus lucknowensis TaxID=176173 RepID=A0ABR4M1Y1_9EURO
MELTFFVGNDGRSPKRLQSHRACSSCRQKKKRCLHQLPGLIERSIRSSPLQSQSPSAQTGRYTPPHEGAGWHNSKEEPGRRFVCDTNPVVALLEDQESGLQKRRKGDVGAWLSSKQCDEAFPASPESESRNHRVINAADSTVSLSDGRQPQPETRLRGGDAFSLPTPTRQNNEQDISRREEPRVDPPLLPPGPDVAALIDIYFGRIHPVLPLLDEDKTRYQLSAGTLSVPLLQTMCLLASKDSKASSHLRLGSNAQMLCSQRFAEYIYKDILKNVPRKEDKQRILSIQLLTLLSLYEWGPDGAEESSLKLLEAIHHCHTIALHHSSAAGSSASKALFWCLWSLDKWNAAINGRPIMMNDCDMSQQAGDVLSLFCPTFRLWLRLAEHLRDVIGCYRPIVDGVVERDIEIPSFRELVEQCEAWDVEHGLLDTFEFFYHAVVILFTYSGGLQGRTQSPASRLLQEHSILTLASLCRTKNMWDLAPIPISAYTLSLAFSITYKDYKASKLQSEESIAKYNLRTFHECLKMFSGTWWKAAIMTRLGKQALDNLDRGLLSTRSRGAIFDRDSPPLCESSRTWTPDIANTEPTGLEDPQTSTHSSRISMADEDLMAPLVNSDFDDLHDSSFLATANPESFDAFLDNFPDVNFPCSTDQCIWNIPP